MKKLIGTLVMVVMAASVFTGCADKKEEAPAQNTNQEANMEPTGTTGTITVVSREDGSGTRGAFIELFGVEEKDASGNKVDLTTEEASITNSTSVMMTSVAGDPAAIGYVSLGSLNDSVKPLNIDGTAPTVENIKSGTYKIARPFNIATKASATDAANDFIAYILSDDGQAVVESAGYISQGATGAYTGKAPGEKLVIAGSSSVTPVMEKLKEAYVALNPSVEIEIQESDSSTGMTSVINGTCDIGMASRELKDSETAAGVVPMAIAMDGIAVVVNNENTISKLSSEEVKNIFTGTVTDWNEITQK